MYKNIKLTHHSVLTEFTEKVWLDAKLSVHTTLLNAPEPIATMHQKALVYMNHPIRTPLNAMKDNIKQTTRQYLI